MSPRNPRILLRYSLAVALCLFAVVLRWALSPYLGDTGPFITMFPMVVFATLLFGIGPGITATLLSAALANIFIYQSGYDGGTPITEAVAKTSVFLVLGGMINWMASNRCPVKILLGDPSVLAEQRAETSERELRATEERLKMAEAVSGYGTWEWDLVTGEIRYSDGIYELTGTEPGPESPESLWKRSLGEDSVKALTSAFERAFEEKKAEFQLDTQITRKDGSLRWITIRAKVIYDESGKAVRAIGLNFDVNKRKEFELQVSKLNKELGQRVGELQAIFDIAPVGIAFSEDPKCNVVKANRALATMVGVRPDDNISTNSSNASSVRFKYLKDGRELTQWELPMQRAIAEKRPILDDEIDVLRADGRVVSMLASACPIFDADGNVIGCVSAQVDVTETRRLMSELQDRVEQANVLRRQAEEASKIKDQFLAVVSHELRTPLSSISGWTTVLKQEDTSDETVQRGLRAIENATKAQTRLINDLLEISKMISGGFRMENRPVELVPVLVSAVETMRPLADQKNLSIEIDADTSVSGVFGDECRIEQVVLNLLHNAIKFSFDGGSIQVALHGDDTDAIISVRDKGRGIGKDFLPFVFEKFRQEDDSIAKSFSGLGLGLAIAKRLVELHGGTIAAESEGEGQGATFTVRLPMKRTALTGETSTEIPEFGGFSNFSNPDAERLKGTKVLVVDDEEDSRDVIKIFLEQCGAMVTLAGSSADALREFKSVKPDIIVSDIGMPDEDGYSLIKKVRNYDGPGADVPAIAVTAFARYEDRSRALTAGFDDHLAKPIEPSELIELIAGLVKR